ncbi:MAG TPA: exo 1,3/1,4-beta-D-glucan glucohydrolase [Woeseiaceae bacterium]|nr:exo 1,3/1,4-beta-D-glucan glucohydrolase [Woeseiaceae bacterium]
MKPAQSTGQKLALAFVLAAGPAACGGDAPPTADTVAPAADVAVDGEAARVEPIDPRTWPLQAPVMVRDGQSEARIESLLAAMTLEEKVGQVIQADISAVTPDDVRRYNLGSILNGGSSAPGGDNRATPDKWLSLADEFWDASTDTSDGGVGIPAIWGTDAVHGHSNILGATIFPHNIGLGMANDPEMMYRIGRVTAMEMLATGLDWTFAPTIAVVRNDRWGRTYESYSEDPRIVAAYAPRIVEGIQGRYGTDEFLGQGRMLATAKHFVGDGGTAGGVDQGDTVVSEAALRDIQAAGYPPAVSAGVQVVMASFNSFHGRKMHGYKELLDDVLVDRMGFDGFVVGDWNGHGQVRTCTNVSCPASFNAGLDMFMAPDSWKGLYDNTLAEVEEGTIPMERLDEAVARILRVKLRAGTFDAGRPSSRPNAGNFELLGAPEHRAVAREAVRKSLVLLKNDDAILPLAPSAHILVTGDGAHNIGKQCGGWTLNWQGTDNLNEHFPNGTSVYQGLVEAVAGEGGTVTLSEDGTFEEKPDVAVVVFGENPYAEFQGDRPNVDYPNDDGLNLLRRFREAGIPAVAVFLSGRPLWVNPEINASAAFVAAWLPGTEGGGIADVLVAAADGTPRHDFTGRLSFSWPRTAAQAELNVGDEDYDPLFAYGYGLSVADDGALAELSEDPGLAAGAGAARTSILAFGDPVGEWGMLLRDGSGESRVADTRGASAGGHLAVAPADRDAQEDTVRLDWTGPASFIIGGRPADFEREANGDMALALEYRVLATGDGPVSLAMATSPESFAAVDLGEAFSANAGGEWQTGLIKLSCFAARGVDMRAVAAPLVLTGDAGLSVQLARAEIVANPGDAGCTLVP